MFRILLPLLLPLSMSAQTINMENELLWEISGNGLKQPSYIFGSFHSNDKRVFKLSDTTFYALRNAQMIVLETDIFSLFKEWDTRVSLLDLEYDNEGRPYVGSPYATETYYGDEDGMPQFLDAFFEQYCWNAKKEFAALETVESQLNLLTDLEEVDYSSLQWGTLMDKNDMLEAYLGGNIYDLDNMLRSSLAMYPNGYKRIITDRNMDMALGLDSLLKTGKRIFSAVGAGHLAGYEGIISLLRKKGYHLRKVLASYHEVPTKERIEVYAAKVYSYVNDTLGIEVVFPGKPQELKGEGENYDLKLIYRDFGQGNSYEVEIYPRIDGVNITDLADIYIASPAESPARKIDLEGGGEAWEGLADSYPEGLYWVRVAMNEDGFVVMKAYGGNKFMNSNRPQRFFEQITLH